MRFSREEVAAILRNHVKQTFDIQLEPNSEVDFFGIRSGGPDGVFIFTVADVKVPTENAVPTGLTGPYRTPGK